jgi:hypothetical protein
MLVDDVGKCSDEPSMTQMPPGSVPKKRIIGSLSRVDDTPSDITIVVSHLSKHMTNPYYSRWEQAKRVLSYLKCTAGISMVYGGVELIIVCGLVSLRIYERCISATFQHQIRGHSKPCHSELEKLPAAY